MNTDICRGLCAAIDWRHPTLRGGAAARAWRAGDAERAALEFVRVLRARRAPRWGYTAAYVRRMRAAAAPQYRAQAAEALRLLSLDGAELNYGWRMCFPVLPAEVYHVAGRPEHFPAIAQALAAQRASWGKWGHQTLYRTLEMIQALWPIPECADEVFVPLLGFLLAEMPHCWEQSRAWHEPLLGTAGHNWWAFEFAALWKVSLYFSEFKETRPFQALFPTYLERELELTLGRDGYSAEHSLGYHFALVDILTSWARIAALNGYRLPRAAQARLRECAALVQRLVAPDGTVPGFGDYGSVDVRDRLRAGAALFRLPEAKFVAERLDPAGVRKRADFPGRLIFSGFTVGVGADLLPAYRRLPARSPATLDTALPHAGLYAMRQAWSPDSDYLAIEACPKGAVVNSHGHTALFNFVLHSRGTPMLIDSSSGWEGDPSPVYWRVGSFAHNVATVDGEHHLPIRSRFRWGQVAMPTIETWLSKPRYGYFSGVHEAYERLEHKVTGVRRKIFYLRGDYWILIDRFSAASAEHEHCYTQHFQVAVPGTLAADGRMITHGGTGNLLIAPVDGAAVKARLEACPYPSDHYPNPDHLTYTLQTRGNGIMATLLAPYRGPTPPRIETRLLPLQTADGRAVSPWEATALEISLNGRRDVYVDLHMMWNLEWRAGGFKEATRLFHSRAT
jgi:hypothetical protein